MFHKIRAKWRAITSDRYSTEKYENQSDEVGKDISELPKEELPIKSKELQLPTKMKVRIQDEIWIESQKIGIFYADLKEFRAKWTGF